MHHVSHDKPSFYWQEVRAYAMCAKTKKTNKNMVQAFTSLHDEQKITIFNAIMSFIFLLLSLNVATLLSIVYNFKTLSHWHIWKKKDTLTLPSSCFFHKCVTLSSFITFIVIVNHANF